MSSGGHFAVSPDSPKVAAWMAGELGLERVAPQRGWEALKAVGWSIQAPRPTRRRPRRKRRQHIKTYGPPRLQAVLAI